MTPILETKRLILRSVRLEDADDIQAQFPYKEILRYMSTHIPWPYPADGAVQFLTTVLPQMEAGREYNWAITLKEENDILRGIISLRPYSPESRGFWLAMQYQGRGLMKEAVAAVTDFGFGILKMPSMCLKNAEPNIASHRLKERAGAQIIATIDNVAYIGGHFRRIVWTLTPQQWKKHRSAFCD